MPLIIRPIEDADADIAAELSGQLGYPADAQAMRDRIRVLANDPSHAVLVACLDVHVVGWIHVAAVRNMTAEPRAEISALVVAERARNGGIGAQLLVRAEQWALQQGLATVVVRSQIKREGAHRFYLREGYQRTKTSAVFAKAVGGGSGIGDRGSGIRDQGAAITDRDRRAGGDL